MPERRGNSWLHAALALLTLAALPLGAQAAAPDPALVTKGEYLSRASDCMACHTRPGGTPFAGGLQMVTPFGSVSTPNITPDIQTGIGAWTDDQFYRAMHDGIGKSGEYLYPVMPFTSYTKMTRDDVMAIRAYLSTLKPVYAPRVPNGLHFPFDVRASLMGWRELFFRPGTFKPNPQRSAQWNRGAYLVQGPGHCAECHSPRNLLGATETGDSLAGGYVAQWLAPNISSDPTAGIGAKTVDQITTFLRTGASKSMGVAFGPMAEVVHDSLQYMNNGDLQAMATYLKDGPDRPAPAPNADATKARLKAGQTLYLQNCAQCHQDNGRGIAGSIPNLAGNAAITAARPNDVVVAVLVGLKGTGNYGAMPSFAGALSDQNVADVANYIRASWANKAPTDATPALVSTLRSQSKLPADGTEAARAFDCPAVGGPLVPEAMATNAQASLMAVANDADMDNRVRMLITQARGNQMTDAQIANMMIAAYCPAVANMQGLSNSQKRQRLMSFASRVQDSLAANAPATSMSVPAKEKITVPVAIPPDVMQQVNAAAAAKRQTAADYMADIVEKGVGK
ncbi:MAG: c-type cytochrome [Alphaproteobacteria bacterium]|nr:c-type cytochrome [Alphaproteobacteria bacterium]